MKTMKLTTSVAAAVAVAFTAVAADVTINVPEGVTQEFYEALAANGYQKTDLTGQRIVKTGLGTLIGTNDLTQDAYKTGSVFGEGGQRLWLQRLSR